MDPTTTTSHNLIEACMWVFQPGTSQIIKYVPQQLEVELDSDEFANITKPDETAKYNGTNYSPTTTTDVEGQHRGVKCDIVDSDSDLQNK